MKKKAKIFILCGVVIAAVAAGAVTVLRPVTLETISMDPESASLTFTEQGTYSYDQEFSVYPLVSGEVVEVKVKEGQRIAAGDVLAVINASDYEYQIKQLESAIDGYNGQLSNLSLQEQQRKDQLAANLESLNGQLRTLEAERSQTEFGNDSLQEQIAIQEKMVDYNRQYVYTVRNDMLDAYRVGDELAADQHKQTLNAADNALAQSELLLEQLRAGEVTDEVYEGQKQALQSQIDALNTQIGKSYSGGMYQYYSAQIRSVQTNIDQMREQAGRTEIISPVGGVVSKLPVGDQNVISQQILIASVGQKQAVEVYVPTRDIGHIQIGDRVELLLDRRTTTEESGGKVIHIDEEAQIRRSVLGVEERKVRVLIEPDRKDLKIGFDVDVRFTLQQWEDVLILPKTAVFTEGEQDYTWVIAEGRLEKRAVKTGEETREGFVVESGLEPGDLVVADCDNEQVAEGKKAVAALT